MTAARPASRLRTAFVLLGISLIGATTAHASAVVGFRDHFAGGSLDGWSSGSLLSNPGTGGIFGSGDGFLIASVPGPLAGNLGAFVSTSDYSGNWTTAGITQVRLWLTDPGSDDPVEVHLAVGNGGLGNFWQCNTGMIPPQGSWAPFTVDLTNGANFTQIGTSGTYAAALANVDRILLRHDLAPYSKTPNTVIGDFGVDEVLLTNGVAGVGPHGPLITGQPVRLAPAAPNPSRGTVSFRLVSGDESPVRIQVVDASGRIVRRAELPGGVAGERSWTWDGADDQGRVMAAGYYRVRAFGPAGGMSRPVVRIP
jgi:hypothetical protein